MHLFACLRKKVGNVALPGWLLSAGVAVYCELLLHLWITENLKPLRFGAVLAFALGFGGLTGLLNSLFDGKKWGKWVTFSLNFLLCVFYLAEFFCVDAYKNFMSPGMMLGGARGVATDFAGVAFSLIWAGAWRILLMLLPVLLYAVFARPVPVGRRTRALLLAAVLGGYGLGYDRFIARYQGLEGLTEEWPESDLEMMDITVPDYIDRQPFSIYYMTVSGHCGYSLQENAQSRKNYDAVKDLDCSEAVKCYLAAQLELEKAMTSLLQQLEEAGIADDTVIVLSPDHYPYGLERSAAWKTNRNYLCELLDVDKLTPFNRDSNTLIIWSGCLEGMDLQVDTPVYSLDILPTLSNLFGVPYDSRLLVGRDVFSEEMPLVLWPNYSWKTDRGTYDAAEGVFTPADGQEADREYIDYVCALVRSKFSYCTQVQNTHYFRWLAQYLEEENE